MAREDGGIQGFQCRYKASSGKSARQYLRRAIDRNYPPWTLWPYRDLARLPDKLSVLIDRQHHFHERRNGRQAVLIIHPGIDRISQQ